MKPIGRSSKILTVNSLYIINNIQWLVDERKREEEEEVNRSSRKYFVKKDAEIISTSFFVVNFSTPIEVYSECNHMGGYKYKTIRVYRHSLTVSLYAHMGAWRRKRSHTPI
jgi:hypothetical protein